MIYRNRKIKYMRHFSLPTFSFNFKKFQLFPEHFFFMKNEYVIYSSCKMCSLNDQYCFFFITSIIINTAVGINLRLHRNKSSIHYYTIVLLQFALTILSYVINIHNTLGINYLTKIQVNCCQCFYRPLVL